MSTTLPVPPRILTGSDDPNLASNHFEVEATSRDIAHWLVLNRYAETKLSELLAIYPELQAEYAPLFRCTLLWGRGAG